MTELDVPQIREAGLAYFYNLARVLKEDFQPYSEKLIDFTLKLAHSDNSVQYKSEQNQALDFESEEDMDEA